MNRAKSELLQNLQRFSRKENVQLAATIFVCFLQRNDILLRKDDSRCIDDNALVALALMVAASKSSEKNTMVKVILNLLV